MRIWLRHHAVRHHHTSPRSHRSQVTTHHAKTNSRSTRTALTDTDQTVHGTARPTVSPMVLSPVTAQRTRTVSQVTVSTLSIRYGSAGRCSQSTQVEVLSSRISFLRAHTIMLFIARSVCASVGAPEGGAPPGPPNWAHRASSAGARRSLGGPWRVSLVSARRRVSPHTTDTYGSYFVPARARRTVTGQGGVFLNVYTCFDPR